MNNDIYAHTRNRIEMDVKHPRLCASLPKGRRIMIRRSPGAMADGRIRDRCKCAQRRAEISRRETQRYPTCVLRRIGIHFPQSKAIRNYAAGWERRRLERGIALRSAFLLFIHENKKFLLADSSLSFDAAVPYVRGRCETPGTFHVALKFGVEEDRG